jgi:hypothetical protein
VDIYVINVLVIVNVSLSITSTLSLPNGASEKIKIFCLARIFLNFNITKVIKVVETLLSVPFTMATSL